jgi:catechol 2,3-dioxygenase-like lactoylglutathione lyase family enzyme
MDLRVCVDVDELDKAIAFYAQALELRLGRRFGNDWAEMLGGSSPIDLLAKGAGTGPCPGSSVRTYSRHWTPVHLDFVVINLEAAVARATAAGAVLEHGIDVQKWGRMANLADPFGHGFCLIEFSVRGYDELATSS